MNLKVDFSFTLPYITISHYNTAQHGDNASKEEGDYGECNLLTTATIAMSTQILSAERRATTARRKMVRDVLPNLWMLSTRRPSNQAFYLFVTFIAVSSCESATVKRLLSAVNAAIA